jgi:glucose/arabinose dehydrogenase
LPRLLWAVAALLSLAVQGMAQRGGAVTPRRVAPATIARARAGEGARKWETARVSLIGGKSFDLNVPQGFGISVAAQGFKRARFMARSPDGRIFVTDMHSLADNKKGAVYILDEFDGASRSFKRVTPYLTGLRNPNSLAFYRDRGGVDWLYLALTDRLLRYRYAAGDVAPTAAPETLATFPHYGLGYKYGGWHLTRTVVAGANGKIYVAVGSSCNACVEKEAVRASILEMEPDGGKQRRFAHGLRNAVGLRWVEGKLYATNMGADHLGDHRPADTMYALSDGANYGWPYCYQSGPKVFSDAKFNPRGKKLNCRNAPAAYAAFDSHSSPLGLERFSAEDGPELDGAFLVALHGSTKKSLKHGYRVVSVRAGRPASSAPEDFITGFLHNGRVYGRPVDILKVGRGAFLLTDDYAGVVYYVHAK